MARNLQELEKQLADLETRRTTEAALIRQQVAVFQESLKPGNLVKTAVKDLFSGKGTKETLMGGAAGIAGTLLVDGLLLRKPSALQLLTGLITSEPVMELIKEDKLGLGKLVEKVKSFIGKKNPAEPEEPVA